MDCCSTGLLLFLFDRCVVVGYVKDSQLIGFVVVPLFCFVVVVVVQCVSFCCFMRFDCCFMRFVCFRC